MKTPGPTEITQLLRDWQNGEQDALKRLTPMVQAELHRLARHYMAGEHKQHTLQATALINEAWLRLIDWRAANWQNRAHFFAVSAQLMRRILVDYARRRAAGKPEGRAQLSVDHTRDMSSTRTSDLVALDDALTSLNAMDPRKGKIVELRFFGGLTEEETAEALGLSAKTVQREWIKAKAWLYNELGGE